MALEELASLHEKKQRDYGRKNDPYANVRASAEFGIDPWLGAVVRLHDKITRIKSFCQNGKLNNESLTDSLQDIAVYAVIALVLFREQYATDESADSGRHDDLPSSPAKT